MANAHENASTSNLVFSDLLRKMMIAQINCHIATIGIRMSEPEILIKVSEMPSPKMSKPTPTKATMPHSASEMRKIPHLRSNVIG